jgi:mRNA interferase RelE/StbE
MTYDPKYTVHFRPQATKALAKLTGETQRKVDDRACDLAGDPRPHGVKPVQGRRGFMRVRQGNYRIIYRIDDAAFTVEITAIGDRCEVYD